LNTPPKHATFLQIGTHLRKSLWKAKPDAGEAPLLSELFSREQMKQHGKNLAASHAVAREHAPDLLLSRLADNEDILNETCRILTAAVKEKRRIAPAGEWLLDNFYLIEQQIRTARRHLPRGYSRTLPRLLKGPSAGLPRVYDLALETISHGDARIDPESLSGFVEAYQTVTHLNLGELWAIPIMLRLALIENLRRVAAVIAADRIDRNLADDWADRMTVVAEKDPKSLILVIADMARSNPPMVSSFIAELVRRLQGQGPTLALPLTWIEQRLSESGSTIEQLVRSENQRQATDQVSISNSIASLRFLDAKDWREFVETMSIVERSLRQDPQGAYGAMSFATRDSYRHVVEKIARKCDSSEGEVADSAIRLARDSWEKKESRAGHVGFYLIGEGREMLERSVAMRGSFAHSLRNARGHALLLYLGSILAATALIARIFTVKAYAQGVRGSALVLGAVLAAIVGSQFVVTVLNWLMTRLTPPDLLPRMDLSQGIPSELRSLVVIPTMLTTTASVAELVEAMEVRFLANRDNHVHFCLLSDFRDADQENMPEDQALLEQVQAGVAELNRKYSSQGIDTFFLLHRPRRWNAREQLWMGYERKRGKLEELNSFLRGRPGDYFSCVVGQTAVLQGVRYVITLDTDTQLPRDSVREFVGAMAHPLNRPVYDIAKQRVTQGYGILQPRVAVSLPGANHSRYAQLWGGEPGIDPYTRAVSDVYQDAFGEGSFIGKGIYDVDVFEQALGGRFPENRILSHDLIEGCYARSGLLSDVQLYEDYPATYDADVARRHRWIRGDWQIARWLMQRVPGPVRGALKNPLSVLSRWKILDNLRRSLVPISLVALLPFIWLRLSSAWAWTLAVLGVLFVPIIFSAALDLFQKSDDAAPKQHLAEVLRAFGRHCAQGLFTFACMPYEAFFSCDAILRALWRMLFSHRRLLEWNASSEHKHKDHSGPGESFRFMWPAPVFAVGVLVCIAVAKPGVLGVAAPILLVWFVSPALAWWISLPLQREAFRLSPEQTKFLGKLSRKTWSFFEKFVSAEDNWLPPDNYQESPAPAIAHRSSPTNMGLALLANLSAYDFGYVSGAQLLQRTAMSFTTMGALERYQGHFYNWYDTVTLKPLFPLYVSTVDSGNLVAHVLTLEAGLVGMMDQRVLAPRLFGGLLDTLGIFLDVVGERTPHDNAETKATLLQSANLRKQLEACCASPPTTLTAACLCLKELVAKTRQLGESLKDLPESPTVRWADALGKQCQAALEDVTFLTSWPLVERPDEIYASSFLDKIPTLRELATSWESEFLSAIQSQQGDDKASHSWLDAVKPLIHEGSERARARIAEIERLALQCREFARVEYSFLYNGERHLMTIGYNVSERRRDPSYYDLLASEARLASFVAIAQGQIPQENWFSLGRQLTKSSTGPTLLSWDGSMFEYLMPLLVMPTYENTLLDESYKAAVARQIEYAASRNVPWGISESGYNVVDAHMNYQYRAFGVPGLGLKRGLAEDVVIAPYASSLALMVATEEACANLQRLAAARFEGAYGFYEAIDFTLSRVPRGQSNATVRSYMAHHQGMILVALVHVLLDRPMQRRFESVPIFRATTLLLQEKVPKATALYSAPEELTETRRSNEEIEPSVRVFRSPNTLIPEVQLLSNGNYHVMVSSAGGGYSRWKDMSVTRWREDSTRDPWGTFCYIRDVATGRFWSSAYQPTVKPLERYEAIFSEGKVEFRCREDELEAHTEIAVSPEDDIELRRVTLTNRARKRRVIEVTSYAEVVLATAAADDLHPAFSNLFVQTEILEPRRAILCTRRPRSLHEQAPWMFHLMVVHGADVGAVSYETDRMQFVGRGKTAANPAALNGSAPLSGSQGSVLDPIVAIRHLITLEPGQSVTANLVSGVGETRDRCLQLIDKYQDRHLADRVFDLAWTHSQVVLRQLNATEADAQSFGRLASSILYANPSLRADASVLSSNSRTQSGLWGYSISGDLPIVLLRIEDVANIDLVRQLVQAHAYWRLKGLPVDLVIWNEDHAGYRQPLHERIMDLVAAGIQPNPAEKSGMILVRVAEQMSNEDRLLFQSVARAIITDTRGPLNAQITRRTAEKEVPRLQIRRAMRRERTLSDALPARDLIHFNGLGGFTRDGREYVITIPQDQMTPAPWVNVIANADFGTVISESGSAYTWGENAHEFRLTPWHNDSVTDASGEAFYLRDEESGAFWSPTLLPSRGMGHYVVRHGFGYSVFEHAEDGILSELQVYVAPDATVKFFALKIKNNSGRSRRLSATGYVEWVLGNTRPKSTMHVITEVDPVTGALFARNTYNAEFPDRVAFFDANQTTRTVTGDRTEFLGRNGTLSNPAGLHKARFSGRLGPGLDPCAAIRLPFELVDGQEREFVFILGVAQSAASAVDLVQRFRGKEAARTALEAVWHYWTHTLGTVNVDTPDQSINVMANGWLLYQTLACRFWARSGYYQSGGAFGFRDQLQDAMALVHAEPQLIRKQLLLCASRQFREGDVQHWWHPPSGRGVRTHCSDDYLWLPLAVCRYVVSTGDTGVLDEVVPFLEGRPVKPDEDSYYDLPGRSGITGTLYDHCVQAISNGLRLGDHGLPLIGSGDWNDGMNLVGEHGKGESVWLGFFLQEVLTRFAELANRRGDSTFSQHCQTQAASLRQSIEKNAWDGEWYRRAYFDDGSPLGSASNPECQIDSIAQSWSVLSGAGDALRSRKAMDALYNRLVDHDHGLIKLLAPPFDESDLDPGYIRGYVPGVRENGGQYTHAAIWAAMAFAAMGDGERAWELFNMINPVSHSRSREDIARYKVEPYVMAADIYAVSPHTGHGGWTWYTGSAGWMYRLIMESLLGLRLEVDRLHFAPSFPADWSGFKVHYRFGETVYHITLLKSSHRDDAVNMAIDGILNDDKVVVLVNDLQEHFVDLTFAAAESPVPS
jgi:cyclic beta-1,2-glucan synthetase